jgi:hypothetical protein
MNDRELLEAAAKAAGKHAEMWSEPGELLEKGGWVQFIGHGHASVWNPLTDDGDAFRLAVKLNIDVFGSIDARMCETDIGTTSEPDGDDPYAAQRRAIVRAAALKGDPRE